MGSAHRLTEAIFDQSLMKIFQRVQEIWSEQESVTEGQTDERKDEGHFYNPPSASRLGIKNQQIFFFPFFNAARHQRHIEAAPEQSGLVLP